MEASKVRSIDYIIKQGTNMNYNTVLGACGHMVTMTAAGILGKANVGLYQSLLYDSQSQSLTYEIPHCRFYILFSPLISSIPTF